MPKRKSLLLVVVLLLTVFAAAGCSAGSDTSRAKTSAKKPLPAKSSGTNSEQGISFKNVFKQMFPDAQFTLKDANKMVTKTGETYYIEQVTYGQLIGERPEFLVVVRRPQKELAHAQGFYNAYLGVFDAQNQKLISPVKLFASDEGSINLFQGQTGTHVFFAGSTTFQGFTGWSGGLFKATSDRWEEKWPKDPRFWDDKAVQVGQDRLIIYKVELVQGGEPGTAPEYKYTIQEQLFWDPEKEMFVSR